jgi:hypothetical protein
MLQGGAHQHDMGERGEAKPRRLRALHLIGGNEEPRRCGRIPFTS